MSTTPSQETVEQTKQQIRTLINEIAELSRSETPAEEYYPSVLKRVVDALAAVGGAIWLLDEDNTLRLSYQINVNQNLLDTESEDAMKHGRMLTRLFQRGQSELVPPNSMLGEDQSEGNPSQYLLVVAPLSSGKHPTGIIEVFQRPNSAPNIQRGYQRFLDQMAGLIGEWLKGHTLQRVSDRQLMWQKADHFARLVHDNLDLRDTAYTIANEGRQLIGCDRVSVATKKGSKCKVVAISGQDSIENRSNIVTALNILSSRVVAAGESLWYDGSVVDLPPQLEEAVEDYVDLSHGRSIAVLPIRRPEKVIEGDVNSKELVQREDLSKREIIGALIVEQIESQVTGEDLRSRCDLVYEHTARALSNSISHSELFLMPVWRFLGRAMWLFRGSALPKTSAVLAIIGTVLLCMFLFKINLDLEANGQLIPKVQKQIFAHTDGEVEEVYVDHGDTVKKGDPLVRLRNRELEIEITGLQGQIDETNEQILSLGPLIHNAEDDPLEKARLIVQQREYVTRKKTLMDQLKLVKEKEGQLIRTSPIDGVVMDWKLKEKLQARPVAMGQVLLNIADPNGEWELEVMMPERRMSYLDGAASRLGEDEKLEVDFILSTDPSMDHKGKLHPDEVHEIASLDDTDGAIVKLKVEIDPESMKRINPRPGAKVIADVVAGRESAAFVWFHEVVEWVQANVLF